MARVWMLWHGGSSYSPPSTQERRDCEAFPSMKALVEEFASRPFDSYYPCCSQDTPENGGPEAHVFFSDPYGDGDAYPDRVIKFGPRGGVRVEYC